MPDLKAIAFDLFNTLVFCDPALLPRLKLNGAERPSTLPVVAQLLTDAGNPVSMDQFAETAMRVGMTQEQDKVRSGREFPASYRWTAILAEMGMTPDADLVEAVVQCHMDTMCAAWGMRDADRAALGEVSKRYPLALLSNFDHGPSARRLLERVGAADLFAYVAISDELGWRKPEARVFQGLLDAMQVPAAACLYVGDSIEFDVAGAHAVGMPAAWIAAGEKDYAAAAPPPAFRAPNIAELVPLIAAA